MDSFNDSGNTLHNVWSVAIAFIFIAIGNLISAYCAFLSLVI
jgi:hypothetical protein